ncbi:hypothetical protein PMAYCL1PPCAC_26346, partial [Pristionchus mayeri]
NQLLHAHLRPPVILSFDEEMDDDAYEEQMAILESLQDVQGPSISCQRGTKRAASRKSARTVVKRCDKPTSSQTSKRFECPYVSLEKMCKSAFSKKSELVQHFSVHIASNPSTFRCDSCKAKFDVLSDLLLHLFEENHKRSLLHACTSCDERFKKLDDLREHVRKHHRF